jgi:hypothetical protein
LFFYLRTNLFQKGEIAMKAKPKTQQELSAMYDCVYSSSEGLTLVRNKGSWFHVLPDGTPAYGQRYDNAHSFSGGVALVCSNGRWFPICHDGTLSVID